MQYKRRRLAAIDMGTNSFLMVIAERSENGTLRILKQGSHVPKLGEGIRTTGKISDAAIVRTIQALQDFKNIAHGFEVNEISITATSAAREASNRHQFVSKVELETGMKIDVIPPNEEARLTYISATSELPGEPPSMVVDIGGGSTEITWGLGSRFDGGRSLNLGTVKLTEAYFKKLPPTGDQIEKARAEIDDRLSKVTPLTKLERYFGTAGSFTHLASLDLKLAEYHPDHVHLHKITADSVGSWVEQFSKMNPEEISKLPGVDTRRLDVLFAGTLIVERLFHKFGIPNFEVIDRGIRFGKIFDSLRGFKPPVIWENEATTSW